MKVPLVNIWVTMKLIVFLFVGLIGLEGRENKEANGSLPLQKLYAFDTSHEAYRLVKSSVIAVTNYQQESDKLATKNREPFSIFSNVDSEDIEYQDNVNEYYVTDQEKNSNDVNADNKLPKFGREMYTTLSSQPDSKFTEEAIKQDLNSVLRSERITTYDKNDVASKYTSENIDRCSADTTTQRLSYVKLDERVVTENFTNAAAENPLISFSLFHNIFLVDQSLVGGITYKGKVQGHLLFNRIFSLNVKGSCGVAHSYEHIKKLRSFLYSNVFSNVTKASREVVCNDNPHSCVIS